tara:strand:+ start:598 stop:780 length:183 start_codon:yes stop_codon:yes gene_type:complete
MNIEQVCKDAIAVVERYLASDLAAADMYDELQEAQDAAGEACAWRDDTFGMKSKVCANPI